MRRIICSIVFCCAVLAPCVGQTTKAPESAQTGTDNVEILSDTQGVDFGPYLGTILKIIRANWYALMPDEAKRPRLLSGNAAIQFNIGRNGKILGMKLVKPTGNLALDRGAWSAIQASNPFPPLPSEFSGPYLALRLHFAYNPKKEAAQNSPK